MSEREKYIFVQKYDKLKKNRLGLIYARRAKTKGSDFHSVIWESKKALGWNDVKTIPRDDIEAITSHITFFIKIHSFESEVGKAIFLVGESDVPKPCRSFRVCYSWREWDLKNNRETKFIRECQNPFEDFE